jgi:hypothetical protein
MECDWRMIIKFLLKEGVDARDVPNRLQAQFGEHAYKLRLIQLWITEALLDRQDLHEEIRIRIPTLDDLDAKILAILDKSPFKSPRLRVETLRIVNSTV